MKDLIPKLIALNCRYNYKETSDGKCYSTTCMINKDPSIAKEIKEIGCLMFKNNPEVKKYEEAK